MITEFIRANTPENLCKEMNTTNTRYGKLLDYFDIQKDGSFWYAWYSRDIPKKIIPIKKSPTKRIKKEY